METVFEILSLGIGAYLAICALTTILFISLIIMGYCIKFIMHIAIIITIIIDGFIGIYNIIQGIRKNYEFKEYITPSYCRFLQNMDEFMEDGIEIPEIISAMILTGFYVIILAILFWAIAGLYK